MSVFARCLWAGFLGNSSLSFTGWVLDSTRVCGVNRPSGVGFVGVVNTERNRVLNCEKSSSEHYR